MDEEVEGGVSWIVIVAVVAVVIGAGAFFAGRALAGGGPETLSEAVEQAQAGELPCGEVPAGAPGQGGAAVGGGAPNAGFLVRAVCAQDTDGAQGRMPGGRGGFATEVKAIEGDTLTLTGPQGDTTVTVGPNTTVSKSAAGEVADIKAGDSVIVSGGRQGEAAASVVIVPSR